MKKISIALAVASALGASAAHSAIMAEYANALLVPRVQYDTATGQDTAIAVTTCQAGTVYWAWYNTASVKQADGQFDMTTNDQRSFTWSEDEFSGFTDSLSGQEGYMTFILDTTGDGLLSLQDSTCLSGNAFYIDQLNQGGGTVPDVAFVPTFPMNLAWGDFSNTGTIGDQDDPFRTDFQLLAPNGVTNIVGLWAGARAGDTLHMRYFVDFVANSGNDTTIFIWGANPRPNSPVSVQQYDNTQQRRSLSMTVPGELSVLDVETSDAFSSLAAFEDGFFEWTLPQGVAWSNGVVSWSVATSADFQATQTLLNPIFRPHIANGDEAFDTGERFNIFEYYNRLGARDFGTVTAEDQFGPGLD